MIQDSGMLRHSLQRLLGLIPTMLMLVTVAFVLIRVAPGGPFDSEKLLPPEVEANLSTRYHLDEPVLQQYFRYVGQVAVLDFGPSYHYKDWTVNELIAQAGGDQPVIATAVHAGHEVRPEVAALLAVSEEDRLREEDPFTDRWTEIAANLAPGT